MSTKNMNRSDSRGQKSESPIPSHFHRTLIRILPGLVALLLLATPGAHGQFGLPTLDQDIVTWSADASTTSVVPGQVFTLRVTATIAPGWHIYGQKLENKGPIPTSFEITLPDGWEQRGDWTPSEAPRKAIDPGFQFEVSYHEGEVHFLVPVGVASDAPLGGLLLKGRVRSQACDANQCLPPLWKDWSVDLEIKEGSIPPEVSSAVSEPSGGEAASRIKEQDSPKSRDDRSTSPLRTQGLGAFLLFAILAGFASLLTPCVFPMIPITVSFFTKRSGEAPRRGVILAVIYALGIVVIYSSLGLLLSAVLGIARGAGGAGAAQWIAANPWINMALGALFVAFALSLFGLFDIQLPSGIANTLQKVGGGRADILGALIMAFVFTVTSFTCTVQFVGLLLVEAARGNWLWPGIGMVAYAAAFASPFFLLALFPQALARLPRSGPWLHSTKVLMGFLELAAAFKFISNADLVWEWGLFNRELVLAAWVAVSVFAGLYLLGKIHMVGETDPPKQIGVFRLLWSMLFIGLGFYLASGLAGNRLHGLIETYLPPRIGSESEVVSATGSNTETLRWSREYEEGLERAKRENRPVFIDFTGVTCTNCRWMELNIFQRPEIVALFKEYVLLQLYTDSGKDAERYQRLQAEQFGTVALPYYVILRPDGSVVDTHGGIMRDPAEFAEFLNQGLDISVGG